MEDSKIESKRRSLETFHFSLGEEILSYMKDDNVFEIMLNPDGKVWINTFDKEKVLTDTVFSAESAKNLIYQVAGMTGQVCTDDMPVLAAELPDGSRFQGFLPRVVAQPAYVIRKHLKSNITLDDYISQGVMTEKQREILVKAVSEKKNIIAAGGTASGKTTLLNAILAEISKLEERIVLIEDVPELRCTAPNCLSLRTTDKILQDALLKGTLRASPDRIVVGEVRGDEALALLDAWSTGHGGGCSTVHSNSAKETLLRLENLVTRVSKSRQEATIAAAVDIVVYLKRRGGKRMVEEIIEVKGFNEERKEYIIQNLV